MTQAEFAAPITDRVSHTENASNTVAATEPIRIHFWSGRSLSQVGEDLGMSRCVELPQYNAISFTQRLASNQRAIKANYLEVIQARQLGEVLSPAAEWLLDNHHVADETFRHLTRDLPESFIKQLPVSQTQSSISVPRTLAIIWIYVAYCNSELSLSTLNEIVSGYQKTAPLSIGEIWAIPAMLRFVLLENLRRISDHVSLERSKKAEANALADDLAANPNAVASIFARAAGELSNSTFVTQLNYRLRDGGNRGLPLIKQFEAFLEKTGRNITAVIQDEHARQSASNVIAGNIIRSLKLMDDIDWLSWFEEASVIDKVLRDGTDYAALDKRSRNDYRDTVERIAKRSPMTEVEVAAKVVELARQDRGSNYRSAAGKYLLGDSVEKLETVCQYRPTVPERLLRLYRKAGFNGILIPTIILSLIMTGAGIAGIRHEAHIAFIPIILVFLIFWPAFEAARGLINFFGSKLLKPARLPGYDLSAGIPPDARTLIVIPCILDSKDTADALVRNLELHYLANPRGEVYFALLTDWRDSITEVMDDDESLLAHTRHEIEKLTERYASTGARRFFLLHRRRTHNPQECRWMGWERKRGKLSELNMLLRGAGDNTSYLMPDHALPSDIRYVLTLDADTRLARDAVPDLVGRITHPVNRAVIDPKTGTVVRGYGILQPRVTPSLTSGADSSHYQRIFSVDRGLDPYVFTASDIYQDLLGEGSFTGKGLYDVDAVETSLAHRVPDNAVLSHDLLEGSWARAALVSDVQLVEDFPTRYEVELSRQHRWARGDWQLLPFIVNMSNGLTATARLKMVDNLRRSLVPVTWVLASCVGWLMLGSRAAIWWQFALMTTLFINPLLRFGFALIPTKPGVALARYLKTVVQDLGSDLLETFLKLTFIADQATAMADAIVRTFYRLAISRKHLLEWRTAHQVHQEAKSGILYYYRLMGYSTLGSTLMFLVIYHLRPVNLPVAAPFCILWLLAPFVAQFISRPLQTEDRLDIRGDDAEALRRIARETWRYFETFANAENNDLPPDNFQETPEPRLAARTSPTNIGLYLLSAISAHDFGWAPIEETVGRIERTLATLQRMEKFRGHIFNWYKTKTLEPMDPRYISAVDSGNLAGYLITVSSALRRWSAEPAKAVQQNITGIGDTFEILCRHLKHSPEEASSPLTSAMMLDQVLGDFRNRYHHILSDNTLPSAVLVESAEKIIQQMLEGDGQLPSEYDPDAFWWAEALAENCRSLVFDSHLSHAALEALSSRLEILSEKARSLAFEMDFGFLLNRERGLLSIGYRMADGELDAACYDLLASEARLASFFAIAKGDLPSEHWSRLGRPVTMVGSTAALVSWSGSMFEYLMPSLVLQEPLGGTLSQSNNAAIEKQIRYARTKGIPWGISESAFHARDRDMNYQYHAFGVPSLGLKRDLSEDTVIAPYASVLAAQYRPADAVLNLARLEKEGARGRFGFYDAVDYTPARIPNGRTSGIVQNYMAHHQGMSIVAIANATLEGIHRSRFHDDPVVEAAELLLQEKAPREIVPITPVPEKADRSNGSAEITNLGVSLIENPQSAMLQVAMLSNGRYAVTLTSNGAGSARIDGLDITRWRADPLCDHNGTKVFLRDLADNTWWQALPGRKLLPGEQSSAQFSDHKAEFMKTAHGIETQLECIAAHDANGEGRRLTIRNRSSHARTIEVTTYGEIVLDHSDADIAHRAFSNMFVKTLSRPEEGAILATRNQRAPHDRQLYFAHIMSDLAEAGPTTAETDRRAFIGRGRNLDNPAAFDSSARFEGGDDFSMDPIFALRRSVTILPGKQAQLVIWNIVTDSQDACDNAIAHYKRPETFEHESRLIWTHSQIRLRHMGVSVADASLFRRFAALLVYPDDSLSAEKKGGNSGAQPQSALWQHGISGDDPIMVLQIDNESDLPHVRKAVAMQEYLQAQGLLFDLVILNERAASYAQDLQNQIAAIVDHSFNAAIAAVGKHHVFGLRKDLIGDEAWQNLLASARITLHAGNGRLAEQFLRLEREKSKILAQDLRSRHDHENQSILKEETALASHKVDFPHEHLSFDNGMGGFSSDGREYVVRLRHGEFTPHPWINVISGKSFGFHVSAEGAGYTWAINSRDYQISPWSNDAVINAPGEGFYIRDNETGLIATPFAALSSDRDALYEARHGMGYSNFRVWTRWIDIKAEQTLDHDAAAKLTRLTLYNKTSRHLSLSVASYVDLVLGNNRERSAPHIQAGFSPNENAVIARNPYSLDYSGDELVCTIDRPVTWWCVNRREFIGPNGSVAMPLALQGKNHSPGKTDNTGGDPCVALATDVILEPGAELSLCFRMESRSHEDQPQPANRLNVQEFGTARARTDGEWKHFLSALQVHTPDPKLDLMVNTWLPYQTLACRIRARAAFYQASGAYGFRDQLQDATALLLYDPSLARSQILNAASRQFVEGDVQHWWLPSTGAGVRSSISDDIVWLSHALVRYITVTGDRSILHEDVPFIQGDPLKPGQHDSFFKPDAAPISASLYEHCARGLDLAVMRTGPNGLPQILGGDWNDGFNRVGQLGQGESIWLGWFLARTLSDFAPIAHERADQERAERWSGHVDRLRISLETAGWDGAWYRRAYYDDGVPLGSKDSPECRIDSIAQSWAAISGLAPRDRMDQAMDAVLERLVDDKNGIIRLFDPPFTNSQKDPGYIKAYPPGVRENGGQYTHAAAWVVQALALLGRGNDAHRCFDMINPISHTLTRDALNHYRTEPYAVAADIYGDGEKTGRGGWTWYTGSAGWLLRAAVEGILGITVTDKGKLHVKQAIPDQWPGFTADIRLNGKVRHLEVTRVAAGFEVLLDGVRFENEPVS